MQSVAKLCACKLGVLFLRAHIERCYSYPPVPGAMRTYDGSVPSCCFSYLLALSTRSDVILPLSSPIRDVDGHEIHELFVPQNTNVYAHIYNFNRDPSIWGPDAADWKPERWLVPLPESVSKANIQAIYANTCQIYLRCNSTSLLTNFVSLSFIGGPRACMYVWDCVIEMSWADPTTRSGFKFSQLEISKAKVLQRHPADLTGIPYAEVALSQIIPAFQVKPAEDEIVWRFGALLSPSVKESVDVFSPKLPIMISRA